MRGHAGTASLLLIITVSTILPTILPNPHTALSSNRGTSPIAPTDQPGPADNTFDIRIAAVEPDFTATAYSSFYTFYSDHKGTRPGQLVRTGLGLLNASLVQGWAWSQGLYQYLKSSDAQQQGLIVGKNLFLIPETNVSLGALFRLDGTRNYDTVILGFTEYVTAAEYQYYKMFVATGGVLIVTDATNFLAEVQYYPATQHVALMRGHGWSFNGTAAWRDISDRWKADNINWTGGTFAVGSTSGTSYAGAIPFDNNPLGQMLKHRFGHRVFIAYHGHEENAVANLTQTSITAHWLQRGRYGSNHHVSSWIHNYRKGYFIHFGGMGSDVITTDASVQTFLAGGLRIAENYKDHNMTVSFCNQPYVLRVYSNPPEGTITLTTSQYTNGETAAYSYETTSITANPPRGYTFQGWNTTGGVAVTDDLLNPSTLIVTCQGTLTAIFQPLPISKVLNLPTTPVDILILVTTVTSLLVLRIASRRMRHLLQVGLATDGEVKGRSGVSVHRSDYLVGKTQHTHR